MTVVARNKKSLYLYISTCSSKTTSDLTVARSADADKTGDRPTVAEWKTGQQLGIVSGGALGGFVACAAVNSAFNFLRYSVRADVPRNLCKVVRAKPLQDWNLGT
jgi:hypothetical protein